MTTASQHRAPRYSCRSLRTWALLLHAFLLFFMCPTHLVDVGTPLLGNAMSGWCICPVVNALAAAPSAHVAPDAAALRAVRDFARSKKTALPSTTVTFDGWNPSAVKLENTGILPAAVAMGRYLLIIGGSAVVPPFTYASEFVRDYALSSINVLDVTMGALVSPLMLVHNESEVQHDSRSGEEPPLPQRVPAELTLPAVGTASTVRLGLAAYVVGFCTMIPSNVVIESDDDFNAVLRSVQVIRLYEEEFSPVDDVTLDVRNTSLPETATLRFNASCVGDGNETIYIFGGVSLENNVPLASVSQYNVVTGQFVEAGWLLDEAIVGTGVLESSELVFIGGGYTFSNGRLRVRTEVSVIDPASSRGEIGEYGAPWVIDWFSPQLIMYNHTLAVMGATHGRSFGQQQVWPDLLHMREGPSVVPIGFVPLRGNAVMAAIPNVDSVTVYLAGGQIPPPEGAGISSDVFTGTMQVDDGHVTVSVFGFHYVSFIEEEASYIEFPALHAWGAAEERILPEYVHTAASPPAAAAPATDDTVSFPLAAESSEGGDYTNSQHPSQTVTLTLDATMTPTTIPTVSPTISPTITPTEVPPTPPPRPPPKDLPNNDGNITVYVNGYEPLWYNFTFNILLSENTAHACPGLVEFNKSVSPHDFVQTSSCLLRLSESPACNSPLLDLGNLTSANAQPYQVKVVDPQTNTASWKNFIAVGPVTLIGSLAEGIQSLTGQQSDVSGTADGSVTFRRRRVQPSIGNNTKRPFYEQKFLYVCFSSGAFSLPQCGSNRKSLHSSMREGRVKKAPCTTAFYKPLNAEKPFVLSPVTKWVPETTTTLPPVPSHDTGISSSIIAALIVCAVITLLALLCVAYRYEKSRRSRKRDERERQRLLLDDDGSDEEKRSHAVGRGAALPTYQKQGLLDGKYRVLHRLGRGSFSVVYLVERVTDGQRFALKYVQCADDVDRLEAMRECEVAYTLQGHPNVIRLVDMFMSYRFDTNLHSGRGGRQQQSEADWRSPEKALILRIDSDTDVHPVLQRRVASATPGERYLSLVMAYHEKGDLGKWIRQQRTEPMIPESTIVSIAFQILTVLQFMHRHDPPIIHRDLKPENILLDSVSERGRSQKWGCGPDTTKNNSRGSAETMHIVVTDFGLSRVMDKTFCETGVGSLPYVAPECWQRRYSTKVDIWAVGCILYAACAKRVESDNVKVMFSECNRPDFKKKLLDELTVVYGYSMALAAFIVYLLEPDPVRRPSAEEAIRLIRKRRRDAVGASDTAMMVSFYKDDKDDDDDDEDEDVIDGAGAGDESSRDQGNDGKERTGMAAEKNTEKRISPHRNSSGAKSERLATAAEGLSGPGSSGRPNVNAGSNGAVALRADIDVSAWPTGSCSTLPTSSFGRGSQSGSRRSLQQQQQQQSHSAYDGPLREGEGTTGSGLSSSNKKNDINKKQQRLRKLEKYFETIAEESEQFDFFIARESPSLVAVQAAGSFKTPGTVSAVGEKALPPPCKALTSSSCAAISAMTQKDTTATTSLATTSLAADAAAPGGDAHATRGVDSSSSRKRNTTEVEVDCHSMAVLPATTATESVGEWSKREKHSIVLACDDGSTVVRELTPSSSSPSSKSREN
ncbi:protein kinase [Trypanosoma grayi]|uniref:protein kinase n=1 Tax=Trypanosoma grayi TaxID=71804 RepID=UPI0004F4AAD2|nr:protein kinase [Trypanosoma grayi]KEG12689.1 protein kinase [Trypanosoma grayi]